MQITAVSSVPVKGKRRRKRSKKPVRKRSINLCPSTDHSRTHAEENTSSNTNPFDLEKSFSFQVDEPATAPQMEPMDEAHVSEHSSPSMKDVKKMVEPCRESDIKAEETMESKEEDINSYFKSCVE